MKIPTIHLNGTSREALHQQYKEAWNAVNEAIRVTAQSAPHARDYYVQDKEGGERPAIYVAMDEHAARMAALETVERELMELAVATLGD